MTPSRPQGVPAEATLLYLDQSFPPGQGVQAATLRSIFAQNANINARNDLNYQRAMSDWQQNKAQCEAYHIRVPPQPIPPPKIADRVTYAKQDGTIVLPPEGADGMHYAWVWEVME